MRILITVFASAMKANVMIGVGRYVQCGRGATRASTLAETLVTGAACRSRAALDSLVFMP
jgi:hypothetical protein